MFNALNRFLEKVFRALNKWSTKKANITWGFSLVMFAFSGFLYLPFHGTFSRHDKAQASLALLIWLNEKVHLKGCRSLFIVKRPHSFCRFYFTTILHFAAPLTAMKIPSAGASTWPVADVATS